MVILDSNILLYGHIPRFAQHARVAGWLEGALSDGSDVLGITWQVATAFMRISTNRRIFEVPLDLAFAKQCLDDLFGHPLVSEVGPTSDHWETYSRIFVEQNLTGDIVMDAHIVAIAVEHNASVASVDKDFRRFSDYVAIIDPLAG
ncbi:MAG: TA system VapC family ribonuclease toxin [Blastocatellia bacterium]